MSIDYFDDGVFTLREAAQLTGKAFPTIYRWATTGIGGIRLETICEGDRRLTSRRALQEFFERVTERRDTRVCRRQSASKSAPTRCAR
jgi:hypothetical protein